MSAMHLAVLFFSSYTVSLSRIKHTVKNGTVLALLISAKVLDRLCERIRYLHKSIRQEDVYVYWVGFVQHNSRVQ